MEQRDARTLSPLQLDELRSRAISLWKKGLNRRHVATLLDVHYNTVGRWVSTYENEGSGALRSAKRGRKKGGNRNLTPTQEQEIQKMITDKTPDQLKMPFALWTRRAGSRKNIRRSPSRPKKRVPRFTGGMRPGCGTTASTGAALRRLERRRWFATARSVFRPT